MTLHYTSDYEIGFLYTTPTVPAHAELILREITQCVCTYIYIDGTCTSVSIATGHKMCALCMVCVWEEITIIQFYYSHLFLGSLDTWTCINV